MIPKTTKDNPATTGLHHVTDGVFHARGDVSVIACSTAIVHSEGVIGLNPTYVHASDESLVFAKDSFVLCEATAIVYADGDSFVRCTGSAVVKARGRTVVNASGKSHVFAGGTSRIRLMEDATVELEEGFNGTIERE